MTTTPSTPSTLTTRASSAQVDTPPTPTTLSQPSPFYPGRPSARFAVGTPSTCASGSGTSTPTVPIGREQSRSPLGQKSTSASVSPELEGFLALHTTLSGTSTIRESRNSLEEESRPDTALESYDGGAPLTATRTAPQPSTSRLPFSESNETAVSPPTRPSVSRTLTDGPTTAVPTPPTRHRPRRQRASTTSHPGARYVPLSKPPPLAPPSRPSSVSPSPGPSTATLQSHLYNGLLNATLSDLHLVVFNHFYRLHRIVLAGQSGFFTSLLSGGFSEERTMPMKRGSEGEVIQVELSSPMTRSAFEFCLARLYGGGPELVPPPWAKTSSAYPLSEPFERLLLKAMGDLKERGREGQAEQWDELARSDRQPATPTFLLALLATSTYLEIPSLAATALEMIQTTITPWTVSTYLGFATGKGLGPHPVADIACRGLEGVGAPYDLSRSQAHWTPSLDRSLSTSSNASYASSVVSTDTPDLSTTGHDAEEDNGIFVGPEGERVGEACACWLAKWGSDILRGEEWIAAGNGNAESFFYDEQHPPAAVEGNSELRPPPLRVWSSLEGGLSSRWVRGVISSDAFFISASGGTLESDATGVGHSGLGSDGEFERYLFAKRVVQLRRGEKAAKRKVEREKKEASRAAREEEWKRRGDRQAGMGSSRGTSVYEMAGEPSPRLFDQGGDFGVDEMEALNTAARDLLLGGASEESEDDQKCGHERCDNEDDDQHEEDDPDEREYTQLFSTGIHYSHMTFPQLHYISRDYSPYTGRLYTPYEVIEQAFFQAEDFKAQIPMAMTSRLVTHSTYNSIGRTPGVDSHPEDGPDLGLATSIDPHLNARKHGRDQRNFYLIPVDDTTRINERSPTSSEGGNGAEPSPTPRRPSSIPRGVDGFFGLALETRIGTKGPKPAVFGTEDEAIAERSFVAYEPCRVGVEFWGVGNLKDKQRLYSSTFFYAGSFFNLYLQRIQKKGALQLGVYLHRQNQNEPFPHPSQPPIPLGSSPSILSDIFKSQASPSVVGSLAPYSDRRKQIRAFFSIWCPNQSGNSLTKFSSGPDQFALSQSWGWKSTSLSQEFLGSAPLNDVVSSSDGRFSSLRVTIVMGLV